MTSTARGRDQKILDALREGERDLLITVAMLLAFAEAAGAPLDESLMKPTLENLRVTIELIERRLAPE